MSETQLFGRRDGYNDAAVGRGVIALAGQTAPAEVIAAEPGLAAEFDAALASVIRALNEAGGEAHGLLHLRIFVSSVEDYVAARPAIGEAYRRHLGGHYPASTLIEVQGLLGSAQVELEGLAVRPSARPDSGQDVDPNGADAVIRLRLGPSDARYGGRVAAGAKAMEIFGDLETELALREGGDEGLCVAYDLVEFLEPLRAGDFLEGRARIVGRGKTSRRVTAELYKVLEVDQDGVLQSTERILAARASATIVVGTAQ